MSYRIPDDDTLADAIFMVLHRHSPVRSQGLMAILVSKELMRSNPMYRASGERIRRLSIIRNLAEVEISYNNIERNLIPTDCPVCGATLKSVLNQTLDGNFAIIGHRCQRCQYSLGVQSRVPGMYLFQKKN